MAILGASGLGSWPGQVTQFDRLKVWWTMAVAWGDGIRLGAGMPAERSENAPPDSWPRSEIWLSLLPRLRQVARRLGISPTDIEDVLQEVSVQAWQKCPADWNECQVSGWLYRVTINRCHLLHRQYQRQSQAYRDLAALSPASQSVTDQAMGQSVVQPLIHAEQQQMVQEQMRQLPVGLQEVLMLKYFANFNAAQIAELLEIPHATVRSRLRQARLRLAAALENTGFDYE